MKILVTGASGTLGRSICRDLQSRGHNIVAYSRDHSRQLKYCGRETETVVGDIADQASLRHAMSHYAVDYVIHAAALKHVDVCEARPSLAVASILEGTVNVLRAVESLGEQVLRTVVVSSDKACQREQTYGMCKYLGEQLVREYSGRIFGMVNSVRFGNLFGSSGSVLPTWLDLIAQGNNIRLRTHGGFAPLRFAMLPSEASSLVVSMLGGQLERGSVVCPLGSRVVDMGTAATAMSAIYGCSIDEEPTLAGERATERMFTAEESRHISTLELEGTRAFQIGSQAIAPVGFELVAEPGRCLDFGQTGSFLADAIGEMRLWI